MDTIHQRGQEKQKGVYHINTMNEITQWEVINATEKITEEHLLPLLEKIIASYPYFHHPFVFTKEVITRKGRVKKKCRYHYYQIIYDRLGNILDVWKYLKDGITLEMLDKIAQRYIDNKMAQKMLLVRDRLFAKIVAA